MDKSEVTRIEPNQSEVARIRREIALSYQACLRVFESPSITAPHNFVTARMEKIAECQEQLVDIVGSDAATRITAQALSEADEEDTTAVGKDTKQGTGKDFTSEIKSLKEQVSLAFQSCMKLCEFPDTATQQAALRSYIKDMIGYQKELTTLTGAEEAMHMMFDAIEGGESVSL